MKIILSAYNFYPTHQGGTEVYTKNFAYFLKAQGYEVLVLAAYDAQNEFAEKQLIDNEVIKVVSYYYQSLQVVGVLLKNQSTDDVYAIDKPIWEVCFKEILDRIGFNNATHLVMNGITTVSGLALVKAMQQLNANCIFSVVVHTPFICPKGDMMYANTNSRCQQSINPSTCAACLLTASSGIPIPFTRLFNGVINCIALPAAVGNKTVVRLVPLLEKKINAFTWLNAAVNNWIVFSDDMNNFLQQQSFFTPSKINTIRHGIDSSIFFDAHLPKKNLPLQFLYAGRFEKIKGIEILYKAWSKLPDDPSKRKLILVGNWKETTTGLTIMNKLIKRKDVIFYEYLAQPALVDLYKQIHCLIIPSKWVETGPLVFHEAIACGCDVITSDVGGQAELATVYKKKSLLFKFGNAYSLQQRIKNYSPAAQQHSYTPTNAAQHFSRLAQIIGIS
jgi:glycosyltransferase involved in cell wall biosynthesis